MGTLDPFIGRVIGQRYRIVERIGAGAFGWVYRADHVRLESPVAVKILNADPKQRPDLGKRFEREAKHTSRLRHPNIITVMDYGEEPEVGLYLVMEYLEGESLEARVMREGALLAHEVVSIGLQIAEALGVAHAEGLVHRDVKPSNVMMLHETHRRDTAMVLDFGIAGLRDARSSLTAANTAIGSPVYMSPEVVRGERADHRSDIYSFGVTLYEMATGRAPFWSDNFVAIYTMHLEDAPVPPSEKCPECRIPPALDEVILRCMEKDPDARFQSMREVREALERVQMVLAADRAAGVSYDLRESATPIPPSGGPQGLETVARSPSLDPFDETRVAQERRASRGAALTMTSATPTTRRRKGPLLAVGAVALLVAAALGIFLALGTGDGDADGPAGERIATGSGDAAPPTPNTLPVAPSAAAPQPTATTAPAAVAAAAVPAEAPGPPAGDTRDATDESTGDASSDAAGEDGAARDDAESAVVAAAPPEPLSYELNSKPSGATVWEGDARLGETPLVLALDRDGAPRALRLERKGYRTLNVALDPGRIAARSETDRTVEMERKKRRPARKKKKKKKPKDPFADL